MDSQAPLVREEYSPYRRISCTPSPVIAADEKVLTCRLDPFEAKLPECIGIRLIIPAAEVGEMMLEDLIK